MLQGGKCGQLNKEGGEPEARPKSLTCGTCCQTQQLIPLN